MTEGHLGDTLVTALVADAVAAPSVHNAQPWRFRYRRDGRTLIMRSDLERTMPTSDPDERNLHVSCGAALFNLRVSAAYHGLTCDVELLPDPEDRRLIASVVLTPGPPGPIGVAGPTGGTGASEPPEPTEPSESSGPFASTESTESTVPPDSTVPSDSSGSSSGEPHEPAGSHETGGHGEEPRTPVAALAELYPQIRERRTSRFPFPDREIPQKVRQLLQDAAVAEGARLVFPQSAHTDFLLDLCRDAEILAAEHPEGEDDLRRWTRLGAEADTAVDGVPEYAFGPVKMDGRAPQRDFAAHRPVPARDEAAFEKTPVLALLSTYGDRPPDWVKAGQALERVLLTATAQGLSTAMTSHALENPDLRVFVRDPVSGPGYVHMVVRLGHGERGRGTPRRPVRDVLVFE